ncbi:Zinc finger protein 287 [Frankliniella fusca]|uniref:Zinc finger protein 287 n=1 Tax=Frankliniella fusca TaxID=407009 RepID=A0AAE1H1S7_9NEOP|nr:Zinc finger protein 287 [Frankliniella fusca]
MAKCCAPNCMNNHKKGSEGFFEFPENPLLRRQWIANIGRPHWSPGRRSVVCSAHFEESQVEMKDKQIVLREGAIPTLFQTSRKKKLRKLEIKKLSDCSQVVLFDTPQECNSIIGSALEELGETSRTIEHLDSDLDQSKPLASTLDKFVVDGSCILPDSVVESDSESQERIMECKNRTAEEQTFLTDFMSPSSNRSGTYKQCLNIGNHNKSPLQENGYVSSLLADTCCKMFLITENPDSNPKTMEFKQQNRACKQSLDLSEVATAFGTEAGTCALSSEDNTIIVPPLKKRKLSESKVSFFPIIHEKAKNQEETSATCRPKEFIQKGVIELPVSISCHKWGQNSTGQTAGTVKWLLGTYMCRLCGIASNKTINLFSSKANETNLLDRISSILPIKIVPDDELPQNICSNCIESLDTCSDLIVSSFRTHKQLASVMGQDLRESSNLPVFFHESERKSINSNWQRHILLMEIFHDQDKPFQEYLSVAYNDLHMRLSSEVKETDRPQCSLLLASIRNSCSVSEVEQARSAAEALLCKSLIRQEINEIEKQPSLLNISTSENEICSDTENNYSSILVDDGETIKSEVTSDNASDFESQPLVATNSSFQLLPNDIQVMPVVDDASPVEYFAFESNHTKVCEARLEKRKWFETMQNVFSWHVTEDSSIKLSCRVCNTNFDQLSNCQHHLESHTDFQKRTKEIIGTNSQLSQGGDNSLKTQNSRACKRIFSRYQCSLCNEHFPSRSLLKSHMQEYHHEANAKCEGCGHVGSDISEVSSHRRICKTIQKEKEWQCCKCLEGFVNESKLQKHQTKSGHGTEATTWLCDICGKRFSQPAKLKQHKKSHLPEEFKYIYQCTHCPKRYINSSRLREHMQKHEEKKYMCKVCGKLFSTKQILKQHEFTHGDPQFLCSLCSRTFFRKSHLLKHMNVHNPENSRASRAGPQPHRDGLNRCRECRKVFDQSSLLNHYKTCHPNISLDNYVCDICKEENTSYAELYQHQREVHKTGVKDCPFCNKTIDSSTQMKYHIMRHEGMFPYNCPLCSNGYTANSVLQDHIRRKHTGEKPFQCQQCSKRFPTNGALAQHSTVHSLPHQLLPCPICNQGFKRKAHLDVHIRTHTGEKPYLCPICDRPFRQRPDCVKHIRVIHGEDPSKFDIRFHPNLGVTFPQIVSVADMELIPEGEDLMQTSVEANQILDSQE